MSEMTIDECLAALRTECPSVEWHKIERSQKVAFWDKQDWVYVKNPYKDGVKMVSPQERYPDLTDAGIARLSWWNLNASQPEA